MKKEVDVNKYKEMYLDFMTNRQSVVLSFIDKNGKPFSSTTPFIQKEGKFYVYISSIAEHYQLMEINEYVDAIFVADESETKNAFAPERTRYSCRPKNLGNSGHDDVFDLFNRKFHESTMKLLRTLDFSLFELTPQEGRYVIGFGLAFDISGDTSKFDYVMVDRK